MQPSQVNEIKQQAIIEKAQDPNSSVSPEAAKEAIIAESKKAGAATYSFNPNASAAEKAAQIHDSIPADVKESAAALKGKVTAASGTAAISDKDVAGKPVADLPPPTTAGAIKQGEVEDNKGAGGWTDEDENFWKMTGWAPRFGDGIPADLDMNTNLLDHKTFLDERLSDKLFGDWYQNTGIIIFACLASWVVAILGGGLGWVFLVMAICGTYYRTSIRRVRRNFRDDVRREMAKARLETDVETLEWINSFLVKFWPIYAPVLCKTIIQTVDQVLSVATPPMIESLKLSDFTLGTKPPRLEHVKTYPKSEDDILLMDWKFSFNPNDTADMTNRQIKVKINPKIVLEIRLGKGMISKALPVIVEDMMCEGLMRVKIKFQIQFPHIEKVEICFLEKPTIDYVCKPIGGDTFGFDINFIPGLEHFILEQIHANLGPMMYAPNVFPIEIAKILAGSPVDQAIGVVQITFHGAQGLSGSPDPYALVKINDRDELGRTKTIHETGNPRWNETVNVIINNLHDTLNIHVFDFNEFRKDSELGSTAFPLERFEHQTEYENEHLELTYNGKSRGQVLVDMRYFPVLGETKLDDGTVQPPPESLTGIVRYEVEQAKELDESKSRIGLLNPYAVLLLNGREINISEKLKRTNDPIWAKSFKEILITDRTTARMGLMIKDSRDLEADPIVGSYNIKLEDLLTLSQKGQEWYNLSNAKKGRAKMKVTWKPLAMSPALTGSGGYLKPVGVMRLYFKNARDLRNLETVGKSDPYVRALLSGVQKARTVTWQNNLNPDFDEVLYVPVHSVREKLLLEVMDEEAVASRDRSLGHVDIPLSHYLKQNEATGEYETVHTGQVVSMPLLSAGSKAPKGTLNMSASFYPCIPTVDPDDEEREKELEARKSLDGSLSRKSTDSKGATEEGRKSSETKEAGRERSGTTGTSGSAATSQTPVIPQGPPEPEKIHVTADNLSEFQTGLLIFTLVDCDLARANCFLEILMDDYVFPSYSSGKIKSRHYDINETGEAVVREMDSSKITLRLIEQIDAQGKGTDRNVRGKLTGPTLQTIQRCLYTPTQLVLRDDQGQESKVTVKLKFIPINMKLDPSESVMNMGKLRVDVLGAKDLPAADRSGLSDPYCKFKLDGHTIHKTEIKKKTLNPQWNESFDIVIRSRTAGGLEVECWDWDMADSDDFLGKTPIDLTLLEPFQTKTVELPLATEGNKKSSITLRMLFTPDYVTRTRQGTSTLTGTFAPVGKVAGAPVKIVGKGGAAALGAVGAVGGGISKTGTFLGKAGFGRRRKSKSGSELLNEQNDIADESGSPTPGESVVPSIEAPDGGSPVQTHSRGPSINRLSMAGGSPINGASHDTGTATISVLSASGFPPSANVRVQVYRQGAGGSGKEVHKTKAHKGGDVKFDSMAETTKLACTADTQFKIVVKDHATFGHDEELGEGTFFVSDQGVGGGEQVVRMNKGVGQVTVRSSFVHADQASVSTNRLSRFGLKREKTPG